MYRLVAAVLFLCLMPFPVRAAQETIAQDSTAAVIMAYQRVGKDEYPTANIGTAQFVDQVEELTRGEYNVLPLADIVTALKAGKALPPRAVALTFDGGYKSVLESAAPLLLRANYPFTVFVATDLIDQDSPEYLSWDDIKKLARNRLVTIGLHPSGYSRLTDREEIRRQINNARAKLRQETGIDATFFAYPFGEYSTAYKDIVAESGFTAGFGQQSGVAYAGADIYVLPRFVMTENFGGLDRFRMTANALPLPVADVAPADPQLTGTKPAIGFSVDNALAGSLAQLSCFIAGQEKPAVEIVGRNRVEIRLAREFSEGRERINCTMPGPPPEPGDEQRWRWFGMLLSVADVPLQTDADEDNPPEQPTPDDGDGQ